MEAHPVIVLLDEDLDVLAQVIIGGREKEWDAEITAQTPDQRIAWKTIGGVRNQGSVTFDPLSEKKSKVNLHIVYEPEDLIDNVGDELGAVELRVKEDLERFKNFIENRGQETRLSSHLTGGGSSIPTGL